MSLPTIFLLVVGGAIWLLLIRYGSRMPGAGKLLDWLGDRIDGSGERARLARFHELRRSSPESLVGALREMFGRLGRGTGGVAAKRPEILVLLPERAQEFFRRWDTLVIEPDEHLLDANLLRQVAHDDQQYVIVGQSNGEPEGWYAVREGSAAVWFLETDDSEIGRVEPEADSIEHFVLLHQAADTANKT